MTATAAAVEAKVATSRHRWVRRLLPLAGSAALAGAAGYVAAHDPGAAGSRYPACLFHTATGLWCPGCGLTRGVHALLTGDPVASLGHNLFTPAVVVAVALAMVSWIAASWDRTPIRVPAGVMRVLPVAIPVVLLVYGVVRNVPLVPFRALAP